MDKNLEKGRISEMIDAIMKVARGDYSVQIKLSGENDELDSLALGLNMTIDDIRTSFEELEKAYQELQATQEASLNIMEDLDRQGKELAALNKQLQQEVTKRRRLEQEAQRRAALAALIYEVGQRVSGELELEALLSEIVTAVRDAFDYYGVMLMLLDEQGERLTLQSIAGGYTDIFPEDLSHAIGEGMTGYAAESGETQVSGDVSKDPHYVREADEKTKSELSVPIKSGEKVIGVLDIQSDELDAFNETEVAAMETLSTQIATAIENARLYEQAQREITERKRAEDALQESEKRLRSLFNGVPVGLYRTTQDGKILDANSAMVGMFHYQDLESLRSVNAAELYVNSDARKHWQAVINREKVIRNFEKPMQCRDGETIWVCENARTVTDSNDRVLYYEGSLEDITERKKAEEKIKETMEELENSNAELEEFAYIVSHDLKAPLRAVNQLATWISEDYADAFDEDGKEQMDLLISRVNRMDNLINGILEYSRAGRIKGKEEEIDLNSIVREVIGSVVPPDDIRVTIENQLPVVFADQIRIAQVFQNLINNAVKFMDKPGGEIKIGCVDEGSHWRFSVADNGPGIDEEDYGKIFQIFQTLESRDKRESTGVGLSVVKKIIELYGGKIWVESKVSKGSTFFFTLKKTGSEDEK